ncbi:unnamed protein product [Miscanthus lutarioriparius]|uniref:Peptidyl-prolyl cis-trans isomerase n=1 Tax=Miscanthus lutarioriparius TaxID=422564 RepID=A0A811SBQ0_9POAL|nr:unnamed protein product [Miscanthus lutarioriparius]
MFYITLRDDLDYLDDKHTVFGMVAEGFNTLLKINEAYVDDKGRPFKNIRIKHTYVLDDPFDDPPQLAELIPENSSKGKPRDEIGEERLEDNYVPPDETAAPEKLEEMIRAKEAHTNAVALQIMGDIPDAEIKPPDNVLFVRPINPVTQDEDLYTIFSRFGTVTSAEIIRDKKTGHSLGFAFIEFETKEACLRMCIFPVSGQNRRFSCECVFAVMMKKCLIDDRRIEVDFGQSAFKSWSQFRQSKRDAKRDYMIPFLIAHGCFRCGAPHHLARDCDQDGGQKNKGLLKGKNTKHSGNYGRCYDLVFHEDSAHSDTKDHENGHRIKIQRVDDQRSEQPSRGDHGRKTVRKTTVIGKEAGMVKMRR